MPTECTAKPMRFARLDRRDVVADFGDGAMTWDAGALLLGATDKAIGLVDRFSACFSDGRAAGQVEHKAATLVGQRVSSGSPAGLRHRAGLCGSDRSRRPAPRSGAGHRPGQASGAAQRLCAAGRQEHAEPAGARARGRRRAIAATAASPTIGPPSRICSSTSFSRPTPGRPSASCWIWTPPTTRSTAARKAASSTDTTTAIATCRSTSSAAIPCCRPCCGAPTSTPAPVRSRRRPASWTASGRAGRGCASCCGPIPALPARC